MKNSFYSMVIITLGYRILGFLREVFIATKFGAGILTDSFFIAQTIPNLLLEILSLGGISSIIISTFDFKNKEELKKDSSIIIGNSLIISLVLFIICYLFIEFFIKILVPGFEKEKIELTIKWTKIILLTFPISILNMVISSFLIGLNKGYLISCSNFLYNLIILIIGGTFSVKLSIEAFIFAINIANALRLSFIIYYYKKNIGRLSLKFNLKDKTFRKVIKLLIPLIVSTLGVQINFIIDRMVASTLNDGAISYLTYVNKLIQLPLGILLGSAILSSYPRLVQKIKENSYKEYLKDKIEIIVFFMGIIIVYILLYSNIIVSLLYNDLVYTSKVLITGKLLKYLSFLLIITSMITLFQKIFHGLNETKIPAKITLYCTIINIILNICLVSKYNVKGIVIATLISNFLNMIILVMKVRKELLIEVCSIKIYKILFLHLITYFLYYFILKEVIYLMVFKSYLLKLLNLSIGFISLLGIYYLGIKILKIDILKKIKE